MERLNDIEKQQMKGLMIERGFEGRKKIVVWKKQFVTAAAVVMIGIPILGFTFPALAQHIPIIGGIFETIESDYEDFSRLQDFSNEVGIVGEVNGVSITGEMRGMSITIEESVFDGQTVYFSYMIESNITLRENFHLRISRLGLRVDGVEVHGYSGWSASPGTLQQVSEGVYIGVGSVSFPDFHENLENAEVHFRLGAWDVAFPVESIDREVVMLNESVGNDGFQAKITQAVISPIGTTLHFSFELSPNYYAYAGWDFFVSSDETERSVAEMAFRIRDDLGNDYTQWGMMASYSDHSGNGTMQFSEALHPEASELIVTPYVYIHHWQLGDWTFSGESSIGAEEIIAGGGSVESEEVILGDIVIPIP